MLEGSVHLERKGAEDVTPRLGINSRPFGIKRRKGNLTKVGRPTVTGAYQIVQVWATTDAAAKGARRGNESSQHARFNGYRPPCWLHRIGQRVPGTSVPLQVVDYYPACTVPPL